MNILRIIKGCFVGELNPFDLLCRYRYLSILDDEDLMCNDSFEHRYQEGYWQVREKWALHSPVMRAFMFLLFVALWIPYWLLIFLRGVLFTIWLKPTHPFVILLTANKKKLFLREQSSYYY